MASTARPWWATTASRSRTRVGADRMCSIVRLTCNAVVDLAGERLHSHHLTPHVSGTSLRDWRMRLQKGSQTCNGILYMLVFMEQFQ